MKSALRSILIAAGSFGVVAFAFGQNAAPGGRGFHRHGPPPHRPGPLVRVLDANRDGVISADEIANAATSLKTLDVNGDGTISADELRPPRPADAPTPPAGAACPRPRSPLMLALDANGDGALSPQEIANAPTSLQALDQNHDGQLTPDEWRPLPPPRN